jgi:ligand-binding SRPBCC domain-containing protein
MSKYTLHRTQVIPGQLDSVFGFFEDPTNLALITPSWLNFRVVSATADVVKQGTRIRYAIRWLGLPMRWESLIASYDKNSEFADQMLKGPYKSWYHTHQFRQVPGGVEMSDRVEYELPLGWLGSIAHSLIVSRQLDAIFNYRTKRITELLGTPQAGS